MPSGKQLSFKYGEISPVLHHKSTEDFFTSGLKKLRNGYVRGEGGVSNRPGSRYMEESFNVTQDAIGVGCRIFSFTGPVDGKEYIVVLSNQIPANPGLEPFVLPIQIFEVGHSTPLTVVVPFFAMDPVGAALIDLDSVEFTQLKDDLVFTFKIAEADPGAWADFPYRLLNIYQEPSTPSTFTIFQAPSASSLPGVPASPTLGAITYYWLSAGLQPQPVAYEVWIELFDGSEFLWQEGRYIEGMPNASTTNKVVGYSLNDSETVKQYNVYRAAGGINAGSPEPTSAFGLVSRIPANAAVTINGDSLITPDMTVTPPKDESIQRVTLGYNIRKIFYAKERYLIAPIDGFSDEDVFCSKLGSKYFWARGLAPTELDAFAFSVRGNGRRNKKGVKNFADVGTVLAFTDDAVFALKGREGGIISFSSINPSPVVNEGIADDCPPVGVDNLIYYLNDDRTSIIGIRESIANPGSFEVANISTISNHLLKRRDVVRMAVTKSNETIVWLLKRDGTLVSVTIDNSTGVIGFARHDIGGFIEDIAVGKITSDLTQAYNSKPPLTDTLMMSVIRDGVRYIERFAVRDDEASDNWRYADAYADFGLGENPGADSLKIQADGAGYAAGNPLLLVADPATDPFVDPYPEVIDVYDSANDRWLRLVTDERLDNNTLRVYCVYDIPAGLQDTVIANYRFPVRYLQGFERFAEQEVVVFADGQILSSPLNETFEREPIVVDAGGEIDLGDYYYQGYVGLPYKFTMETLPLESSDNRTFSDKGKLINAAGVAVDKTLSGFITQNPDAEINLDNAGFIAPIRNSDMENNAELFSGVVNQNFPAEWDSGGSLSIHQVDPLPITVAAVYPKGIIGG